MSQVRVAEKVVAPPSGGGGLLSFPDELQAAKAVSRNTSKAVVDVYVIEPEDFRVGLV